MCALCGNQSRVARRAFKECLFMLHHDVELSNFTSCCHLCLYYNVTVTEDGHLAQKLLIHLPFSHSGTLKCIIFNIRFQHKIL